MPDNLPLVNHCQITIHQVTIRWLTLETSPLSFTLLRQWLNISTYSWLHFIFIGRTLWKKVVTTTPKIIWKSNKILIYKASTFVETTNCNITFKILRFIMFWFIALSIAGMILNTDKPGIYMFKKINIF